MQWTIVQLSPKPQISKSRSSTICVVVKRPNHHCGDDLVELFSRLQKLFRAPVRLTQTRWELPLRSYCLVERQKEDSILYIVVPQLHESLIISLSDKVITIMVIRPLDDHTWCAQLVVADLRPICLGYVGIGMSWFGSSLTHVFLLASYWHIWSICCRFWVI